MPAIVTVHDTFGTTTTGIRVADSGDVEILRVSNNYYLAVGSTAPDGHWLCDVLPAGEWVTEWAAADDGLLIVHITRGE